LPARSRWAGLRAERQAETLRALLLAPAPRPAIYVGKLLGIVALLSRPSRAGAARSAAVPGAALRAPVLAGGGLVLGTVGFAAVGTLFAAMLVRARSRDVLLPVLLYPITVPVIIAGVRATAALLEPELEVAIVRFWMALLLTFDVVFVTLALWTFEPLMTD
jgi:ABC-type transport system involved in cytochrome c biogenesis permease component